MAKEFNPDKYKISEGEGVYDGPHSTIDAVSISVGKRKLPLLRKEHYGYSADFESGPSAHSFLQKKGYPVFRTWRYDRDAEVDYISDLRRGGTHRVVDFCGLPDNYERIYISNLSDLEKEAEALLSKLADDGIVLSEPNIFFDVEISTGIAKIVLGDLREIGGDVEDERTYSRDEIFAHNKSIMNGHMSRLKDIMINKAEDLHK